MMFYCRTSFRSKYKCIRSNYINVYVLVAQTSWCRSAGFGGVATWSLDMDDFTGSFCRCPPYPLLRTMCRIGGNTPTTTTTKTTTKMRYEEHIIALGYIYAAIRSFIICCRSAFVQSSRRLYILPSTNRCTLPAPSLKLQSTCQQVCSQYIGPQVRDAGT